MHGRREILVVDDEPVVGERLQASLGRDGFVVEVFVDPQQALARLAERPFDIVVSDIRMGEVDGLRVMAAALAASPGTRVIMITGYATLELARESLAKGAFDFIAKPFKLGELREAIQRAVEALEHEDRQTVPATRD